MGLFWLTLLAVVSLWIFVSLGVALSLHQEVGRNTWHLRLLQSYDDECYPETKCVYFKQMLFAPIKYAGTRVGGILLFCFVILFRFITDWVVMPMSGEYVSGAFRKDYWNELVTIDDEDFERKSVVYAKFSFSVMCIALLGIFLWIVVVYFLYQGCKTGSCKSTGFSMLFVCWGFVTILSVFAIIRLAIKSLVCGIKKSLMAWKESDWWKMLSGKFCATLTYKD